MANAIYTKLPNRAAITVNGSDAVSFLQGLLTQDVGLVDIQPLTYACLLTAQGKFLYDMLLRKKGDAIIIDCEGGERANALLSTLTKYKLRAKVTFDVIDNVDVFQIWDGVYSNALPDPRHPSCGYRAYSRPNDITEVAFDAWDEHRIQNDIPDGSHDLIPEKSYIHEGQLDKFNAVSYKKGCYVGQELVSRMHHRGLTKKMLKCVSLDAVPDGAEVRSTCNAVGLALVRL